MLKVGVTGGIGSGKSIVCEVFKTLGIAVFNSDDEAKHIINDDEGVIAKVKVLLGNEVYNNGVLDRKKVATVVFNDKTKLEQLNAIVHPAVGVAFNSFCEKHKNDKFVIKEAAILFESGANKGLDSIIVVTAPDNVRVKRVVLRDKVSEEEVMNRMKNQLPQEEKMKWADHIIDNSGEYLVVPQVLKIYNTLSA